jgi:hypothetical protein
MNSINYLIEAMRDKFAQNYEADVSAEISGLAEIAMGSEEAFSTLIVCLKTDPGFLVQQAIARALVSVGTKRAVARLIKIMGNRQENWELRNILIQVLGDFSAAYSKRRKKSILKAIKAICAMLEDTDMYRSVGRVIEAIKGSADVDIVSFINHQLEVLHQKGIPVQIAQAQQIELPILAEIRAAHPSFCDRGEGFPHFRLGIVKGEFLTLDQLTKEFGLIYFPTSFRKIDRTEAEKIISGDLANEICYGHEKIPPAQAIVLARGFLECLKAENSDEQAVRYYTGSQVTFDFFDKGVVVIGNNYAGCIWFSCGFP